MFGYLYSSFSALFRLWINWTKTQTLPNLRLPISSVHKESQQPCSNYAVLLGSANLNTSSLLTVVILLSGHIKSDCWNSVVFNKQLVYFLYFENLFLKCSTRDLGPVNLESAGRARRGDGVVGPSVDSERWCCVWKLIVWSTPNNLTWIIMFNKNTISMWSLGRFCLHCSSGRDVIMYQCVIRTHNCAGHGVGRDGVEELAASAAGRIVDAVNLDVTLWAGKLKQDGWSSLFCTFSTVDFRCIQCHLVDMTGYTDNHMSKMCKTHEMNLGRYPQCGPSGCTLSFVDNKTKVLSQYSLLILKQNSQF